MKKAPLDYCVGIDGCRDGWIVVYSPISSFSQAKAQHYKKLSQLKEDFSKKSIIVIDIPIGLETTKSNRMCDIEARKFLGSRSSTVFSPPCVDALYSKDYDEARVVNLKRTGKSISKQSWFLSKKILEARECSEIGLDLKEGHPECSFAEFLGRPIIHNKKGMHGLLTRVGILNSLGFNLSELVEMLPKSALAKADDLIDATILCWTASRLSKGKNRKFPTEKIQKNSIMNQPYIYI